MPKDTIITIESIPVMFVSGDGSMPIPEQAHRAIIVMESALPSLRGRKCYGVVVEGTYRACVALKPGDDPAALRLAAWTIPGGCYALRKLVDWRRDSRMIPVAVEDLLRREDLDRSRPIIEFYRSHRELRLMAPVK
jgi:hypothetical protein